METLAVVKEVETDWLTVESKVYVIAVCMSIHIDDSPGVLVVVVEETGGEDREGEGTEAVAEETVEHSDTVDEHVRKNEYQNRAHRGARTHQERW